MRNFLTVAALVSVLMVASGTSHAMWYMVNGRAATYAEIQYLAANGVPSGSYWVDAKGNLARAPQRGYARP
jgi:hypothetical protein